MHGCVPNQDSLLLATLQYMNLTTVNKIKVSSYHQGKQVSLIQLLLLSRIARLQNLALDCMKGGGTIFPQKLLA